MKTMRQMGGHSRSSLYQIRSTEWHLVQTEVKRFCFWCISVYTETKVLVSTNHQEDPLSGKIWSLAVTGWCCKGGMVVLE